ncbi:hypothetical protein WDW37_18545 [Bdellovibrionota bacterium FG-1]
MEPRKLFENLVLTAGLLLLLVGCSQKREVEKSAMTLIYPHDTGWRMAESHGVFALENGLSQCTTCHDTTSTAKNQCRSCHEDYPHEPGWKMPEMHAARIKSTGKLINDQAIKLCATECHGPDLGGGLSKVGCASCHDVFPHKEGWLEPAGHGQYAMDSGTQGCRLCHGADLRGSADASSCNKCHADYPHLNPNWTAPGTASVHAATFVLEMQVGAIMACATCHGANYDRKLKGKACVDCHTQGVSHSGNWGDPAGHGAYSARAYTSATNKCVVCHKSGTSMGCFNCHENYPHLTPNWLAEGTQSVHAATFIQRVKNGTVSVCAGCHGADFSRAVGQRNCLDCHTDGVTHMSDWAQGNAHGKRFSSKFTSNNGYCWKCHGAPVPFIDQGAQTDCFMCHTPHGEGKDSTQTKAVLSAASFCYSCHWAYPHTTYSTEPGVSYGWGPSTDDKSLTFHKGVISGHVLYVLRNPLYTDANGQRPMNHKSSSEIGAMVTTCGGSTGLCHNQGLRSTSRVLQFTPRCTEYCHKQQ